MKILMLILQNVFLQVELDLTSVPLGSQFAVDYFFPDRKKLVTGHR